MLIDFYLYSNHEVMVWDPILRRLIEFGVDARLVLEPPGINTAHGSRPDASRDYRDSKTGPIEPLMTRSTFNEIYYTLSELGLPQLQIGRYRSADAVVTTQGVGWLWRYEGALKLKTAYGCAANRDVYGHSEMNLGLDGVFVHGEESHTAISRWVPSEDVVVGGYPKFCPILRGEVDRADWEGHFGLDPGRSTVVYMPTWAHNSSLRRFAPTVARLAARFNVVVKPHHNTVHFEPERLHVFDSVPGVLVQTTVPSNLPFLAVSDLLLADVRSGGLTEAFLLDKKSIGLSANGDPAEDNLLDGITDAAPIAHAPEDVARLIDSLIESDPYRMGRRAMSRRLFSPFGGEDDIVTAQAMMGLIRRKSHGHELAGCSA